MLVSPDLRKDACIASYMALSGDAGFTLAGPTPGECVSIFERPGVSYGDATADIGMSRGVFMSGSLPAAGDIRDLVPDCGV